MYKKITLSAFAAALFVFAACKKDLTSDNASTQQAYLDLPATPYSYFPNNSKLNNQATLGRVLFYDKHLSINNAVACASCHKQEFAFADDVAFSRGFENRLTGRNSMPIQNMSSNSLLPGPGPGFGTTFLFWDGREENLTNLILRPVANHVEMGISNLDEIPAKLASLDYYNQLFVNAYGDDKITLDRISESVATFLSSIQSNNTRFDQHTNGANNYTALEEFGMNLFNTKYNCNACHNPTPSGYMNSVNFMDIGLPNSSDMGRSVVTKNASEQGMFKIPNLRNVALTAPYMHDGRFETLGDVLEHYSSGIQDTRNLDFRLRGNDGKPMRMNISEDEQKAIIAFLNTLTDYDMITDVKFSTPFKTR